MIGLGSIDLMSWPTDLNARRWCVVSSVENRGRNLGGVDRGGRAGFSDSSSSSRRQGVVEKERAAAAERERREDEDETDEDEDEEATAEEDEVEASGETKRSLREKTALRDMVADGRAGRVEGSLVIVEEVKSQGAETRSKSRRTGLSRCCHGNDGQAQPH